MKLTRDQFARIEHVMPKQRGGVRLSNYDFVCAMLYIIENDCQWRDLPKEFGDWYTTYCRFNRWSKCGIIERIFEELQNADIIDVRTEIVFVADRRKKSRCEQINWRKGKKRLVWLPRLPKLR